MLHQSIHNSYLNSIYMTLWTGGNQQFTSKNIVVTNSNVAISMLWDWGWTC